MVLGGSCLGKVCNVVGDNHVPCPIPRDWDTGTHEKLKVSKHSLIAKHGEGFLEPFFM